MTRQKRIDRICSLNVGLAQRRQRHGDDDEFFLSSLEFMISINRVQKHIIEFYQNKYPLPALTEIDGDLL